MRKFPFPFFLAFMTYSLILFIEKVAFNSHALIEHDHGDHDMEPSHAKDSVPKKNISKIELDDKKDNRKILNKDLELNIFEKKFIY